MSSGEAHIQGTAILSLALSAVTFVSTGDWRVGAFTLSGTLAGVFLTPDLDQPWVISASEQAIIRYTLGLGYLWLAVWHIYATLIPHRSPLSHWPILGTAGRLLWLFLVYLFVNFMWGVPSDGLLARTLTWGRSQPPFYWYVALLGLVMSDTLHFLMDLWPVRPLGRR